MSFSTILAAVALSPAAAFAGGADATTELATDSSDAELAPAEPLPAGMPSALEEFKKRHETVLLLVKTKVADAAIQAEVDRLLDYKWIAAAALGGKGRSDKRCDPRCAEYEDLLSRLIRQNYLKRITQAETGKVEYLGEERRAKASKVTTRVTFTKDGVDQKVEVAYIMHIVDGQWFVRDIITDGVSLSKNYRYEFNKIMRDEKIDGLIARLETKLADLAKTE
ncbi:MAG: ABC transporter substrate-binding protein [Deltaproteobacteria bacterium]|nr:ABC transporter substrate-binding protein [Nannocystaceae bacterium]